MQIFQKFINRLFTPPNVEKGTLQSWRETILSGILTGSVVLGFLALVANLGPVITEQAYRLAIFYGVAYLWILFLAFNRRLPYTFRAANITFLPFVIGTRTLIQNGLIGDSLPWLLTSAVLAAVLLSFRVGITTWLMMVATLVFAGFLHSNGIVVAAPLSIQVDSTNFLSWASTGFDLLLLGGVSVFALGHIVNGLDNSLGESRKLSNELVKEQQHLETYTKEIETRLKQIRAAAEISRTLNQILKPEILLEQFTNLVQQRLDITFAGVFLLDETKSFANLRAGSGELGKKMIDAGIQLSLEEYSTIAGVLAKQKAVITTDTQASSDYAPSFLSTAKSGVVVPLQTADKMLGALSVHSDKPDNFDQEYVTVLQGLGDALSTSLENARLFQETQIQFDDLNTLFKASEAMITTTSREDALITIARHMMSAANVDYCTISSWDRQNNALITEMDVSIRGAEGIVPIGTAYDLDQYPLSLRTLQQNETVFIRIDDPDANPAEIEFMREQEVKRLIMRPLVTRGAVIGLIELLDRDETREPDEGELRLIEALSSQAAAILENTRNLEQAQRLAKREQTINQISERIRSRVDIESVITTTVSELSQAMGLREATIHLGTDDEILASADDGNKNGIGKSK